ncbi:AAEL016990-PA, partial [Aedes aegypti]
QVWIFGDVWCRVWLAVDVWMCTASILNLCAISLDRYVAVTRPVTYPSIMSTRRAKSLIAGLWVLSFVICFPPLVGWKEQKVSIRLMHGTRFTYGGVVEIDSRRLAQNSWLIQVTNFFSWHIFLTNRKTPRLYHFSCGKKSNNFDDSLTLRMHRGKGVGALMASTMRTHNMLIEGSAVRPSSVSNASSTANANPQISISCPSGNTSHLTSPTVSLGSSLQINLPSQHNGGSSSAGGSGSGRYPPSRPKSRRKSVFKEAPAGISRDLSPNSSKKLGKKHLKVQVKRFRMETKAAKTLAIIVGGFIICWLPFFTMYLIRAFCDDCINDTLFSILFWLGYCNSAVNPFIYALFSRDFRQAFKRIIMRCFCWKRFKINLLKKSSTTQHTNNHSYSPSAFTPLASTPRTELDST